MIICHYCGKEITSQTFWSRFDEDEERVVPVCNDCAAAHVDERHTWGLVLEWNVNYKKVNKQV